MPFHQYLVNVMHIRPVGISNTAHFSFPGNCIFDSREAFNNVIMIRPIVSSMCAIDVSKIVRCAWIRLIGNGNYKDSLDNQ